MSTDLNGLPKQWLHWAQCAGLKSEFRGHKHRRWKGYYLVGRGRKWRVNDKGEFECSVANDLFDRWAISRGARVPPSSFPKSKSEFKEIVELLVFVARKIDDERRKEMA